MTETVSGPSQGAGENRRGGKAAGGLTIERIFTTPGVHPYDDVTWERRDVVQTELEDRRYGLRAARCRVPRLLVGQRRHDRHDQVLPRRGGHRRAEV